MPFAAEVLEIFVDPIRALSAIPHPPAKTLSLALVRLTGLGGADAAVAKGLVSPMDFVDSEIKDACVGPH